MAEPTTLMEAFNEWADKNKVPKEARGQAEVIFMTGADYAMMLMGKQINTMGMELSSLAGVQDAQD